MLRDSSFRNAVTKFYSLPLVDNNQIFTSSILKIASQGPDAGQLNSLGIHPDELTGCKISTKPDHVYLHVITAGAGEMYGPNLRADYYHEKPRVVHFPEAPKGKPDYADLGPGLEQKHHTFMSADGVFRHHDYSTPPLGNIIWQRYNKPMHRGEVILELPLSLWKNDIERFEAGTPIMWSQGSLVPYDLCSRCGFKFTSKTPSRCDHIQYHKLDIPEDGLQVCVYNPDMDFYELSAVGLRPADKIAYCLRKVADESLGLVPGKEIIDSLNFPRGNLVMVVSLPTKAKKRSVILNMANLETKFDMLPNPCDLSAIQGKTLRPDEVALASKNLSGMEWPEILHVGKKLKCMLAPDVFYDIVSSNEPGIAPGVGDFAEALKTAYRDVVSEGDCESVEDDTGYVPLTTSACLSSTSLFQPLQDFLSLNPQRTAVRSVTVRTAPSFRVGKKASEVTVPAKILAREYVKYQTQYLAELAGEAEMYLAAAGNQALTQRIVK